VYQGGEEDISPAEGVSVQQGYIEGSNVSAMEEMIKMVEVLRAFESAQKAIQVIDEITGKMVNEAGLQ
jgi:flagellar basal-body rod protein FlgG